MITHAQQLERWLGSAVVMEGIARKTAGWYGKPIPIIGVPGHVSIRGDGEFVGPIRGGHFASLADYSWDRLSRAMRRQLSTANVGFASLSDLITEATTGGKSQVLRMNKTGVAAAAVSASQPLWAQGALPVAGANAAAAAGGTSPINTTTGALGQADPGGTDTLHLTTATIVATVVGALMMYDYYFGVNNSVNATNTAVTGVPTRYQSTAAAGSFASGRVTTVLSVTATNFTLTYMDQAGNTAEAAAAVTGRVSSAVQQMPFTAPQWFIPLNAGDTGIRKITNIQSSGANTGVVDWFLGMPLCIVPCPIANVPFILDGINSAFNLVRIQTAASLAFMEYYKSATTATTYDGTIQLVAG